MATTTATATATQQLINPYIYYFQRDSEGIDAQIGIWVECIKSSNLPNGPSVVT